MSKIVSTKPVVKCQICGDRASGHNWNAYTCTPCRYFFQRNFLKYSNIKCPKDEKCIIDFVTRRGCTKCRLKKCFEVGMKVKYSSKSVYFENIDYIFENIITKSLSKSHFPNESLDFKMLETPRRCASLLNTVEHELLQEIEHSMMDNFIDERYIPSAGEIPTLFDIFNYPSKYARQIVKFCNSISAFKNLNPDDQFIALKSFYFEMLHIRMAFMYSHVNNGFPVFEDESGTRSVFIPLDKADRLKCFEIYKEKYEFLKSLNFAMENDSTIRDLMIVLLLFSSYQKVSSIEYIRQQYFIYYQLLRRYLLAKYQSARLANDKIVSIEHLLEQLNKVKRIRTIMVQEIDLLLLPKWLAKLYIN